MASTSMTLGEVWTKYLKEQVESGEYASASEVVREALRAHKTRQEKLAALQAHIGEGIAQADAGQFVDSLSPEELIERAKARRRRK